MTSTNDQIRFVCEIIHINTLRSIASSDNAYAGDRRARKPMENWLSEQADSLGEILEILPKEDLVSICSAMEISTSGSSSVLKAKIFNTLYNANELQPGDKHSKGDDDNDTNFQGVERIGQRKSNNPNLNLEPTFDGSDHLASSKQPSEIDCKSHNEQLYYAKSNNINRLSSLYIEQSSISTSRNLTTIAVTAATAAVGASIGRDFYKGLKKETPSIKVVLAAIVLSGWVGYDLARGVEGTFVYKLFRYYILNAFLICVLIFLTLIVASGSPNVFTLIQILIFFVGVCFGLKKRSDRNRFNRIVVHNAIFLNKIGLRDVGGREQTFVDRNDNELVVHDVRQDAIILRYLNRRGIRAKLVLDNEGRFVDFAY